MFFSHLKIAKVFYKHIDHSKELNFQLDKKSFYYGSVKPDISKMMKLKHDIYNTYELFNQNLQIAKNPKLDSLKRSESLGIVYHFICDYFCKYHSKYPYSQKSLMNHFFYELQLHMSLKLELLIKIFTNNYILKSPFEHIKVSKSEDIVLDTDEDLLILLKSYLSKKESTSLDLDYTFYKLNIITEEILDVKVFDYRQSVFTCLEMGQDL